MSSKIVIFNFRGTNAKNFFYKNQNQNALVLEGLQT